MPTNRLLDAPTLIRMEYLEMPDLKLTLAQARRLFGLPIEECESALDALVRIGFLARRRDGAFVKTECWAEAVAAAQ